MIDFDQLIGARSVVEKPYGFESKSSDGEF
jgi:hypothetical protein